jgi:hypothetical protein
MRHRGRTMLTALVAVLALGVVASASASAALPEFVPAAGQKLPATLEGSMGGVETRFEVSSGTVLHCTSSKYKGEVTGAKVASLTSEMTGCKNSGGYSFHSIGAPEGDINLPGTAALDYTSKSTKKVALVVKLKETELRSESDGVEWFVKGSVVMPLTPINTLTSKLDITIKESKTPGLQEVSEYENEKGELKKAKLEMEWGGGFVQTSWNVGEIPLTSSKSLTVDA